MVKPEKLSKLKAYHWWLHSRYSREDVDRREIAEKHAEVVRAMEKHHERDELDRLTEGPGRGWWGPPRGTHTGKEQGAANYSIDNLAAEAERIGNSPVELLVGWSADGERVVDVTGDGSSVPISLEQEDAIRGGTCLHSHPTVASFSHADIQYAGVVGMKETWVADPKFLYHARPASGKNWPSIDAVNEVFYEFKSRAGLKAMNMNETELAIFKKQWRHEMWTEAAPQLGLEYSRRER